MNNESIKELVDKYSPFFLEVRRRILFVLIIFAATSVLGFVFYERIIKFLINILNLREVNVVFTSPFQFINLAISTGFAVGIVFTFPIFIYQLLSFLKPALRKQEYQIIVRFLPFSLILFLSGFLFGALIMKWQIDIFMQKSVSLGIGNVLDISNLLTTVIVTSALMGLSFQFPIVLLVLMKMGIIKAKQLGKWRMWIYLGSFIFAVLLPPDSILADVLLSLPIIGLFEVSIFLNKFAK